MKHLFLLLYVFTMLSCSKIAKQKDFYDTQQDKITFLVFDKSKADSFTLNYSPLTINNPTIKKELLELHSIELRTDISPSALASNTVTVDSNDFNLAIDVIHSTFSEGGESYFAGSLNYLFFQKCLPIGLTNKWSQSNLGDFKFNTLFFTNLYSRSDIFKKLVDADIQNYHEDLLSVIGPNCYNEITPNNADEIKNKILKDSRFADIRFKTDKDNFLYLLDKTIIGEWRLFINDWD